MLSTSTGNGDEYNISAVSDANFSNISSTHSSCKNKWKFFLLGKGLSCASLDHIEKWKFPIISAVRSIICNGMPMIKIHDIDLNAL